MIRALLCTTVALSFACANDVDSVDSGTRNSAPVAMLTAPVIAPSDQPVMLDASESFDPEGDVLTFVFELGDGSDPVESIDPVLLHTFNGPGLFTVVVRAIDVFDLEGLAAQDVTVRLEYPDPPDFCSETVPCVVGDLCDGGVCFSTGGTID
ncbi:MAG: PKD domain-containing protein [Myxococcota bacterium]